MVSTEVIADGIILVRALALCSGNSHLKSLPLHVRSLVMETRQGITAGSKNIWRSAES